MVEETEQKNAEDCRDVICAKVGSIASDPVDCITYVSRPGEGRGVEELLPWAARRDQSITLLFESGDQIRDANSRRGLELRHRRAGGDSGAHGGYRRRWIDGGDLGVASGGRIGRVRGSRPGGGDAGRGRRHHRPIRRRRGESLGCIVDEHRRTWRSDGSNRAIGGGGSGGGGAAHGRIIDRRNSRKFENPDRERSGLDELLERKERGVCLMRN